MSSKVILFGGSFDPVHKGHIETLQYVHNKIDADKSILIPTRRSPFKSTSPQASNRQRYEMLNLAVEDIADFEVSDIEFKLPEPSYSLHTVQHFRERFGEEATLYWLCGADAANSLHKWYRINEMLKMCRIILACRGGYPTPDIRPLENHFPHKIIARIKEDMLQTPKINISSTEIREAFAKGCVPSEKINPRVCRYILKNKTYLNDS